MWKANSWQTLKWWQELTLPLARSAKYTEINKMKNNKHYVLFLLITFNYRLDDFYKIFEICTLLGNNHLTWRGGYGFFVSFRIFFFGQRKSKNIYFFCRAKREIFFQDLTLGYMTKTPNQIIFFSSNKIRIFFNKKTYTPPPFKLNGPSLNI